LSEPLVSVVLTTRDRPRFLPIALECYRRQTYSRRELVVVDDGEQSPAAAVDVERAGRRLLRLDSVATLGTKLNLGCEAARGAARLGVVAPPTAAGPRRRSVLAWSVSASLSD